MSTSGTDIFNEKTTGYVTLTFKDENKNLVVPDSATYTLYDEESGNIINGRNQTAISGILSSTHDLKLEPDDNVIVATANRYEAHILLVEWLYNTDDQGRDEYRFIVKNLAKVS